MPKVKLSKSEVSQTFDLSEIYGRKPTRDEAFNFIESAKERIIERSQSNEDVNGNSFTIYSKDYAEFKGVGRSDVDMTLFGDMLEAIDGQFAGPNVTLEITGAEATKAYAHMTGYKGHPTIKNGPKREFFGLTDSEAEAIALSVERTVERVAPKEDNIDEILRNIGLEFDDQN